VTFGSSTPSTVTLNEGDFILEFYPDQTVLERDPSLLAPTPLDAALEYCRIFPLLNAQLCKVSADATTTYVSTLSLLYPTYSYRDSLSFESYVFVNHLHAFTITYTIAESEFASLVDPLTGGECSIQNTNELRENREKVWIECTFVTPHIIYAGGAIQIEFLDTTHIPKLHPHCRSNNLAATSLSQEDSGAISAEIGCFVEGNSWVITAFAEVPATSTVSILG
jgi:hypothetical protein